MHNLTENLLREGIALQVAALEWDAIEDEVSMKAIEAIVKEITKTIRLMKKEF